MQFSVDLTAAVAFPCSYATTSIISFGEYLQEAACSTGASSIITKAAADPDFQAWRTYHAAHKDFTTEDQYSGDDRNAFETVWKDYTIRVAKTHCDLE